MESLKKPETIISLINTTALLGVSVYFYRRINGLEQEIDKHTEHLTSTIKKVKEMQVTKQHIQQLAGAIRELNNVIGAQRNELNVLRNLTNFQNDQIKELQGQTKELGGDVKLLQQPYFPSPQMTQQPYVQPQMTQQRSVPPQVPVGQVSQGVPGVPTQGGIFGGSNQGMNQGYNQAGMNQFNQGSNQVSNQGLNQGFNQGLNQSGLNQGYNQGNNQGNNQGLNTGSSLIDLGNLNFSSEAEEPDLDDQIDAVRRARQNSNGLGLNL